MKFIFKVILAIIVASILILVQPVLALDLNVPQLEKIAVQVYNPATSAGRWSIYCKILSGEDGIEACNIALLLNPEDAVNWNNRGQKLFNMGRYVDALTSYDHALLIDSEYSLVLANRCGVLSKLEKYSQALASCDLALKGNQQWGNIGELLVWNNRGDALFNLGRYEESLEAFDKALMINPYNKSIIQNRAVVVRKLESRE